MCGLIIDNGYLTCEERRLLKVNEDCILCKKGGAITSRPNSKNNMKMFETAINCILSKNDVDLSDYKDNDKIEHIMSKIIEQRLGCT